MLANGERIAKPDNASTTNQEGGDSSVIPIMRACVQRTVGGACVRSIRVCVDET
jgi:hypothetical protein